MPISEKVSQSENDKTNGNSTNNTKNSERPIDFDDVLTNELGQFGRFQLYTLLLIAVPLIMSAFSSEYIFSATAIPYRCRVPECGEVNQNSVFEPEWISNAIPYSNTGFDSCQRFAPASGANDSQPLEYCPANMFSSTKVKCDEFVYARNNSVVYDFNLGCQEWLRTLSGTLNSMGTLFALPITGYISDRYGRRIAMVINGFNFAFLGLMKAFSVNYAMYMAFQILQTTFGSGLLSSGYVLAAEFVGPKYRVRTIATCSSMFSTGMVLLGAAAWIIYPWRYLIITLYVPCFMIVSCYWILSESVRWQLANKRYDDAKKTLKRIVRINQKQISDKYVNALINPPANSEVSISGSGLLTKIMRSKVMLSRVCITPIWWITTTFVYYGLSINSVNLSDTMYLNFILTCAIEIPGYWCAVLALDRIGRKATLTTGFIFSAVCNIAFVFVPQGLSMLRLMFFLAGKFGISSVFTSLYLYTSELYPTQYRHRLLAWSSMIGRIGSILAPMTPILAEYWKGAPNMIFGILGLAAALLVLSQPETLHTKMPDTMEEAEALGRAEYKEG